MIARLPIIQRIKDGLYFHIDGDCYERIDGVANRIPPEYFRAATRNKELEIFDMELSK